jgi:signal transduction histidine kinase
MNTPKINDNFYKLGSVPSDAKPLSPRPRRSIQSHLPFRWQRYGVAVLSVLVMALVRYLLDPILGEHAPYLIFLVAVVLTAWLGGFGPAVVSLVLGWCVANFFFGTPRFSLVEKYPWDWLEGVVFIVAGLVIAGALEAMAQARRQVEHDRERVRARLESDKLSLESIVAERTSELSSANARLEAQMSEVTRLETQIALLADEERIRLGTEMYGDLCQQLAATRMLASSLWGQMKEEGMPLAERAERIADALSHAERDAHSMVKELLPVEMDSEGLMSAISDLVEQTRETTGLLCEFECADCVQVQNNSVAMNLFRIAREGVSNAVKHARAMHVFVMLARCDGVTLTVRDDGVGIKPEGQRALGNGLRILQYRARLIGAEFSVETAQEGGTIMRCIVPTGGTQ